MVSPPAGMADEVLDGPRSLVLREAHNRMVVQMAVLHRLQTPQATEGVAPSYAIDNAAVVTPMLAQIIRFYGHAMQGMMGSYLEKNLQTFTEIQGRLADPALGLYEPAALTPEIWGQFLNGQAPAVQGLMSNYLEQSKSMFAQMQEQMAKQAETLFPGMPGFMPPKR